MPLRERRARRLRGRGTDQAGRARRLLVRATDRAGRARRLGVGATRPGRRATKRPRDGSRVGLKRIVVERRTIHRHSAGGVLYRRKSGRIDVCIIQPRGTVRWQLPKGWIEEGEEPAQAAAREVAEETGCRGSVEALLDEIDYWFYGDEKGEKVRIHKNVTFFLLRYEEGDPSGADPYEVADVRWLPAPAALQKIEFTNERVVLRKALDHLTPTRTGLGPAPAAVPAPDPSVDQASK